MARSFDDIQRITQNVVKEPETAGPAAIAEYETVKASEEEILKVRASEEVPYKEIPPPENMPDNRLAADLNHRVDQSRRDNREQQEVSVGLLDADSSIEYFFTNVIQPTVTQNGEVIQVPIIYGDPERWTSMSKIGYIRDNKGKLMLPIIMYRRTGFAKNDTMLFPRTDNLSHVALKKWDKTARYDKFTVMSGKKAPMPNGYTMIKIPNYVVLTYEFIVWTAFIEQMNPIIERINFTDNTYWGDPNRFKFRTQIENFTNAVELTTDTERMVKTDFTVSMYGYLLPKDFGGKTSTWVSISPKKIVFEEIWPAESARRVPLVYDAQSDDSNYDFQSNSIDIDLQNDYYF